MSLLRTRDDFEREERERLAPFAVTSSETRGRLVPEESHPYRTAFQRDRDRVIHSRAFRRLEYKTQVFVYHEGDHYRNRLTHTLEGAQIARTVATAMPDSPLHEYLLDTLGWIEHRHGDQEAALGLLNQAVVALRGRHEVHEHLAAVYQAMGNRTWATYHLDQSRINKSPLTAEVSEQ